MYKALKTPFRVVSFAAAGLTLLLSGCATPKMPDIKVWPFGDSDVEVDRTTPENSTKYICDAGRKFYVRTLNNGESVWLILTDRQFGLDKVASDTGKRYSNGNSVLNINGEDATFDDGPTTAYKGCKVVEVKK
ncbi:MAG: MliC family protein [Methylophilaceae bacterium]|nr:MliC family protein [Methyloradius sp.]